MRECEKKNMPVPQNLLQLYESFLHPFSMFILCSYFGGNKRMLSPLILLYSWDKGNFFFYVIMVSFELLLTFVHHSDLNMIVSCVCNKRND